jgi:hypothetical protein
MKPRSSAGRDSAHPPGNMGDPLRHGILVLSIRFALRYH